GIFLHNIHAHIFQTLPYPNYPLKYLLNFLMVEYVQQLVTDRMKLKKYFFLYLALVYTTFQLTQLNSFVALYQSAVLSLITSFVRYNQIIKSLFFFLYHP